HDAVIDRLALIHVGEIVLLQAELAVSVQHEVDRLAVILLDQLLEFQKRAVERMVVVELNGAMQGDDLLGLRCRGCEERHPEQSRADAEHSPHSDFLPVAGPFDPWAQSYNWACPKPS